MQIPLQITFRGMEPSTAVEARIREKATKLERFQGRITGCKVVVDLPHRQHKHGTLYAVRVELAIPGREILASKGIGENHAHEDVYVAVRDAFDAVIRQLEAEIRVRRDHQRGERNQPDY